MPSPSALVRHLPRILLLLAGGLAVLSAPTGLTGDISSGGIWPQVCGTGLMLCALFLPSPHSRAQSSESNRTNARKAIFSALIWILLLPLLGWAVTSLLCTFMACRGAGCSRPESLCLSILLCAVLWAGMELALGVHLPGGIVTDFLMERV